MSKKVTDSYVTLVGIAFRSAETKKIRRLTAEMYVNKEDGEQMHFPIKISLGKSLKFKNMPRQIA